MMLPEKVSAPMNSDSTRVVAVTPPSATLGVPVTSASMKFR